MKINKAILTGGGRGTRLYPITTTINKHLLPLANEPMIFHAIKKVAAAGFSEIFININPGDDSLPKAIGSGERFGVKITFFEQTGGPQGIAHVVNEAKKFIGDEPFLFYLSDNIMVGDLLKMKQKFENGDLDCLLALATVPDPNRFGVPIFDSFGKLIDVVEKPETPPNNFAVTGLYFYGPKIFFETFSKIGKSARGEYEISSIHSDLLKNKNRVGFEEVTGWWKDTGKPEDLIHANNLLLDARTEESFRISSSAICSQDEFGKKIEVGDGTVISGSTRLIGPVIIGKNCSITGAVIGPYVTIGDDAEVIGASIDHSMIFDQVKINYPKRISESLIGKGAVIAPSQTAADQFFVGDKSAFFWG